MRTVFRAVRVINNNVFTLCRDILRLYLHVMVQLRLIEHVIAVISHLFRVNRILRYQSDHALKLEQFRVFNRGIAAH
ncbi:hypothetical protein D3C73_1550760 [compost metagenome]